MKNRSLFAIRPATGLRALLCSAGLLLAAAAQAQSTVTLYGLIDLGFSRYSGGGVSRTGLDSGQDAGSRFGFRGREDLGDGLSAIFKLEASIAADTGGTAMSFNRESYVGLEGRLGQIVAGRVWSVTDDAWSVHRFSNFSAFIFPEFGNFDRTYTNALKYRSPSFGGFQGSAVYSYGESSGNNKRGSAGELGLTYEAGSTAVFLSHSVTYNTATVPVADKLTVLAARHGIGQFTLRGAWLASRPDGSGLADTSIWLAGADYAVTPLFSVGADHLRRKVDGSAKGNGVTRVLVNYELSKRTGLYAYFARLTNKGDDTQSFRGSVEAGASQTGINVGVRHRF